MFDILPIDIEIQIYKYHFNNNVLPELLKRVKMKDYYKNSVLPELINIAIMDQAARLINSIISINGINGINGINDININEVLDKFFSNISISSVLTVLSS